MPVVSLVLAIIVVAVLVYILWAKDPFHQLAGKDEYDAEDEVKI